MIRASSGTPILLALAVASLGIAAGQASAATTDIGAVTEVRAGMAPFEPSGGGYAIQLAEATGTYAVPPGYGVITAWSHSTGTATGLLTFKVYRPAASAGQFSTVAADRRTVTAKGVSSYPVRIPVRPGDRLGLSSEVGGPQLAFESGNSADMFGFFPPDADPPPGTTVALDGPPGDGFTLDVAATVETDRDGDGFGDDSQESCPRSAATQGPCPLGGALPTFVGCPGLATNVIRGTVGRNRVTGTRGGDRIFAGAGNDSVRALAGDDCVDLGPGTDNGDGGPGNDLLVGGPGSDVISGSDGSDRLRGEAGSDRLEGDRGNDHVLGGAGDDRIFGGSGSDSVRGEAGRDRISGGRGGDRIVGGSGNDRISERDGRRDSISCGSGRDTVAADRIDRISRGCERVRRGAKPSSKRRR